MKNETKLKIIKFITRLLNYKEPQQINIERREFKIEAIISHLMIPTKHIANKDLIERMILSDINKEIMNFIKITYEPDDKEYTFVYSKLFVIKYLYEN